MRHLGIRYPLEKFADDFSECGRLSSPPHQEEHAHRLLLDYFASRYSGDDAVDKMMRCLAAASYWEKNREHFDTGDVSVNGEVKSLLSPGLIWAFWMGWCRDECDWRTYNPPVSGFIAVAKSYNKSIHPPS